MFGTVKKWLGIEGVKLEIILPDSISKKDQVINGKLRFHSMNTQTVTAIKVTLIEKYSRGRGKEKLIDEYILGTIDQKKNFDVPEHEHIELEFSLPFELLKSEMDEMQDNNFLVGGLVKIAKSISAVKSTFRLEAEAKVKGTALNPFVKKEVVFG